MQSMHYADPLSGTADVSETHPADEDGLGFSITPQDARLLQIHLEEFEEGDKADRTQLIDRMMGELFLSRPRNASFDKIDAKTVSSFHVYQIVLRISHALENSKMVL